MKPEEIAGVLEAANGLSRVEVRGLMTMPPFTDEVEKARPYFKTLMKMKETHGLSELSMGMSDDFEIAIEEGANWIRVGTALMGERARGGRGGMKIVFIGAGNMAEALVKGLTGGKTVDRITVTDTRPERLEYFRNTFGVSGETSNVKAVDNAGTIFLAVKPQVMSDVLAELKGQIPAQAVVISIAAGIRASTIESGLGGQPRVVRVMPNTPALVGAGASAICPGRFATEDDLKRAERMLSAVGTVARVKEEMMDAVTALSGSGPAYVFYLMESMWPRRRS